MTTLNARANQAWLEVTEEMSQQGDWFAHEQHAFEEGWETGYKTARAEVTEEIAQALKARRDEARTDEQRGWPLLTEAAVLAREIGAGGLS